VVHERVNNLIVDVERMRSCVAAFEEDEVLGVIGPTVPEIATLASPGSEALIVKGKASAREKCSNFTSRWL
jgi:hypothetical protein